MRAFAVIQVPTTAEPGYWGSANGSSHQNFARGLDRWLDRHGAALGCVAVALMFVGAVDLVRLVLTLL